MEIFEKLGIDGRLLLAQLVNFGILLYLLHRFVYGPILIALQKRAETIEKSLADAKAIDEQLRETRANSADIISSAHREAAVLLERAEQIAEQKRKVALQRTKDEVVAIVTDAKAKIALEKTQMLVDVRTHLAELVITAAQKVIEHSAHKEVPLDVVHTIVTDLSDSPPATRI